MPNRKYRHAIRAGWSKTETLPKFMDAAGDAVNTGGGPYSLIVEDQPEPVIKDKDRATVLSALRKSVQGRKPGTVHRVRNRRGVRFTGKPIVVAENQRKDAVRWARWMVNAKARIHYSQVRPYHLYSKGYAGQMTLDCSASLANLYKWAGANDPYGNGYNGTGNSYELHNSASIPRASALPGDSISWNGHVVMLLEDGGRADPLLFSHGSEAGPYAYRLSTAVRVHGTSFRCHRMTW